VGSKKCLDFTRLLYYGLSHGGATPARNHFVVNSAWGQIMTETTYARLRDNLDSVFDRVANGGEVVVVHGRGDQKVAMLPVAELPGFLETAHLLRSRKNAIRLKAALRRAEESKGKPSTPARLRRELGFEPAK
jgi:antitoxin YefM